MNMKYLPMIIGLTLSAATTPLLASATPENDEMARAIAASLADHNAAPIDDEMARVLEASRRDYDAAETNTDEMDQLLAASKEDHRQMEETRMLEEARANRERQNELDFEKALALSINDAAGAVEDVPVEDREESALLAQALAMSLDDNENTRHLRAIQDAEYEVACATDRLSDLTREEETLQDEHQELLATLETLDSEIETAESLVTNSRARSERVNNENPGILAIAERAEAALRRLQTQREELAENCSMTRIIELTHLIAQREIELEEAEETLTALNS